MKKLKVATNHHWRPFLYRNEVPERVLEDEFDWCDDESSFMKYKGEYYHLSEFWKVQDKEVLKEWDGYKGDTYFSGLLIKTNACGDGYKIGLALSQEL